MKNNKLYWTCRRGMKELEMLLIEFLQEGYNDLNDLEKGHFEEILKQEDPILLGFLMGQYTPFTKEEQNIIGKIKTCLCRHYKNRL